MWKLSLQLRDEFNKRFYKAVSIVDILDMYENVAATKKYSNFRYFIVRRREA